MQTKRLPFALLLVLLSAGTAISGETRFYGFIRFDAILDDSRLSHHQFPNWVLSEDPSKGKENDGHFGMHPRLTRMGVKFKPVDLGSDRSLRGVIETDFQNGGSESRQILRIRHAYFNLRMGAFHFLAGQTWDLISPLYPAANIDGLMWNTGNLGDRHPQARLTYKPAGGHLDAALALGQTGAVDRKDLDGNGVLDGSEAMQPFVQARVGLALNKIKAGAWFHRGAEETATPVGGDSSFTSSVVGVDASVPLGSRLSIEGEGWSGSNLSDIRGGIGQGINLETGEEISSSGGWAHLAVRPAEGWKLFAGAMIDAPEEDDVPEGGRTRNQALYLVGHYRPWKKFQAGLEYINWKTEYKGLEAGTANRVDLHFTYYY